ncbi:MAG: preprotein translocase subunit YajC [Armatimonadota bacterium]|nr:preprotein translocase subunit YajC [Armatimonadota bacterium]MDR7402384.1 preprotein translocase subunit YajC [Armatimonadota bacterium]MDR7404070.1 preprotein translocase subunit YajC [Armatimonadota bacterium]MDR7437594.1 preprotein translocase subunit YajC [Armatimonadota bacterium]MDR7472188.1 preprotein translocase subunit YajC [Armatimonadota bacterium]
MAAAYVVMQATQQASSRWLVWYLLLILAVFYVFMIRPQMTQQRRRREMLKGLKKGDRVVTIGGLHATIWDIDDENTLTLELAPNLRVKADRGAVSYVRGKKRDEQPQPVPVQPSR